MLLEKDAEGFKLSSNRAILPSNVNSATPPIHDPAYSRENSQIMNIQNQSPSEHHSQINNRSSEADIASYMNQPRPKSMQGARSHYTKVAAY